VLAVVSKDGDGYRVRFERRLKHPVEKIWSYLTDNEKLVKWFSELRIEDLRPGGRILFDMQDGTFEEMEIFELEPLKALEFAWGEDRVRFCIRTAKAAGSS